MKFESFYPDYYPDVRFYDNFFIKDLNSIGNMSSIGKRMKLIYESDLILIYAKDDYSMDVLKEFNDDIFKFVKAMGFDISNYDPNKEYPKYECLPVRFDEEEFKFDAYNHNPEFVICNRPDSPVRITPNMYYLNDLLQSHYIIIRIYDKEELFKAVAKKFNVSVDDIKSSNDIMHQINYLDYYLPELKNVGLVEEKELKRVIDMNDLEERIKEELKSILK
jgi:hypothetical protein